MTIRYFTSQEYLLAHPDVVRAGDDALRHYLAHGQYEGRCISFPEGWSEENYLNHPFNIDIKGDPVWSKRATEHWLADGRINGRPFLKSEAPRAKWRELPEWRQKESVYFSLGIIAGEECVGEYGNQGWHSSRVFRRVHEIKREYEAESVIQIRDGIIMLENGGPSNRGQIYLDDGAAPVFESLKGSLCLECHYHPYDGKYYVTGKDYNKPSAPGWRVSSADKVHWSMEEDAQGSDMLLGMCSDGADLVTFGSAYMDWGYPGSYPVMYRNRQRVDALPDLKGSGAWGAIHFKGRNFGGICGQAKVWCPGVGIVLDMPGFTSIHHFIIKDGLLMAFVNRDSEKYDTGAVIMASPTGDRGSWINYATFPCPLIFDCDGKRAVGGKFSQEAGGRGFGKIFELGGPYA